MNRLSRKIIPILIALTMSLSVFACTKKADTPITSNWKYAGADTGDADVPVFVCDNDLDVTLYLNGKIHYGSASETDNGYYLIEYIDSARYMEARITGDTMKLTVQGSNAGEMKFEVSQDRQLIPVVEEEGTDAILAAVISTDPFKVEFTNQGDQLWLFGEYYSIEINKDGRWYYAPTDEPVVVHDLAHEMEPGQSSTLIYDLSPYGSLAPGEYRIACGDIGTGNNFYYAYFTVEQDESLSCP